MKGYITQNTKSILFVLLHYVVQLENNVYKTTENDRARQGKYPSTGQTRKGKKKIFFPNQCFVLRGV